MLWCIGAGSRSMSQDQPFFARCGIEFGYLLKGEDKLLTDGPRCDAYTALVRCDFKDRGVEVWRVVNDETAVEIASPIFKSMDQAASFYWKMQQVISHYPLVSHRPDCYSAGGHVHIAVPEAIRKDRLKYFLFLLNLYRDVTNRPYLNWIFNEWCDVQSAESYVNYGNGTVYGLIFNKDPKIPKNKNLNIVGDFEKVFDGFKGYAVRLDIGSPSGQGIPKKPTVELRFFDAKRSWEETRLHLNFAHAYLRYIWKFTQKLNVIKVSVRTKADISKIAKKENQTLNTFRSFVKKDLGLDPADYEYFININYRERARNGWLQ